MMVYEQITFFLKNLIFSNLFFDLKIDFLIKHTHKNLEKPGGVMGRGGGQFYQGFLGFMLRAVLLN